MVISEQGRNPRTDNCKTHRPCFLPSSSVPCTSGSFHLQNKTYINNDNENIYKAQNPVWQDHSKCMHTHVRTHMHTGADTRLHYTRSTNLTLKKDNAQGHMAEENLNSNGWGKHNKSTVLEEEVFWGRFVGVHRGFSSEKKGDGRSMLSSQRQKRPTPQRKKKKKYIPKQMYKTKTNKQNTN